MTLTGPIVLLVLVGALLHASWNALIKSGADKPLDTALVNSFGVLLALPAVALFGMPRLEAWPYLLGSMAIHIGYYIALAGAYRHGELGLTYPIMRGSAPLLVALGSASVVGEGLSLQGWLGVLAISGGVIAVGLSRTSMLAPGHRAAALRYAFANAAIIATYTLVDGIGVRVSGDAPAYLAALFLFDGIPYLVLVLWRRGTSRRAALGYMRARWKLGLIGSLASVGSYSIALWAMTRAPVAAVAALRETSVLFAALIGTLWLKESFGAQRAAGTVVIVAGVAALRFS